MPPMRTILSIDLDVEQLLRQEMRRTDRSMKAVVNGALRVGLGIRGKPPRTTPCRVESHAFGFRADIDINRLVDKMEADDFAR